MKKRIYVALCAAGITLVTGCMSLEEIKAAQEKAKAERIAEAKKRKEAKEKAAAKKFAEAKKSADAGDGRMAFRTGAMLEKGIGVKQNLNLAITYYEKAVQAGERPNWHILNLIYKTRDTEHSKLFGDCYQWHWDKILAPNVWNTKNKPNFGSYERFKQNYENSVKMCLNFLGLLQKSGKDAEAYALKKRLISIVQKKPSGAEGYDPSMVTDFLKKLEKINTKVEKQIAERKFRELDQNEQKKYPNRKLGKGIRLFKDIYAGVSFEWFQCKATVSNQKIKSVTSPMFQNDFFAGIPEKWQGQTFRQNYAPDEEDAGISYIFAGADNEQTMIGCCISLRNISAQSIIEKYKKEFPRLKIQEKRAPQMRFIIMLSPRVRIQVIMMQPGNFVSIFIADQKYVDLYRSMIQKSAQEADQKALDF